ncbi:MAG: TIGR02757 family protein [Lishizhenia sp.]
MEFKQIKDLLEHKVVEFNSQEFDFISTDPIQIPHLFSRREDIEISALLIATIAWGNRTSIIKNGKKLVAIMGNDPYNFVLNYSSHKIKEVAFVHRTFNKVDLDFFFRALQHIYQNLGGLEKVFSNNPQHPGIKGRIINFRKAMLSTPHEKRSEKHLSNPEKNSSAKRLNMFLRWMVRKDNQGVDFGIWNSIPTAELYLPLDVHTGNVARKLRLLTRTQNDWKALEELMLNLQKMDEKDPVKYDFALFGLGAFEGLK